MRSARARAPPTCRACRSTAPSRGLHAGRLLRRARRACSSRSRPRRGNADIPQAGAYTLNSIAAVVIGGTSLLGGTGGAIGSIFGALVLRAISFNFRIFDVAAAAAAAVRGPVLLAAVTLGAVGVLRVKNRLSCSGDAAWLSLVRATTARSLIASLFVLVILATRHRPTRWRPRAALALLSADLSAAAAAGRLLPRHRRRRHDARHPARPHRPVGALDAHRRRHDGDGRRRRRSPIPVGLGIGLAVGLVNGLGVAYLRVPSMIFTLGVNAVMRGLMVAHTGGFAPQTDATPLMHVPRRRPHRSACPMALFVWALVSVAWCSCSRAPRSAATSTPSATARRAAYLVRHPTRAVLVGAFALCGLCAGLAGVLLAGYSTKAYQGMGDAYLLPADRRGGDRRHQHPRRPRPLSRHGRRRDPDRALSTRCSRSCRCPRPAARSSTASSSSPCCSSTAGAARPAPDPAC